MVRYINKDIRVIRMGLQASDGVSLDGDIVTGPYHPAFGQLVKSHIAYEKLVEIAKGQQAIDDFELSVPYEELSDYIGQRKCNIEKLKKQFGYRNVIIKPIK